MLLADPDQGGPLPTPAASLGHPSPTVQWAFPVLAGQPWGQVPCEALALRGCPLKMCPLAGMTDPLRGVSTWGAGWGHQTERQVEHWFSCAPWA